MREALGLCPTSKLLYASDASRYPEVFLVAASAHAKRSPMRLVSWSIAASWIRSRPSPPAARLSENARRIYKLKMSFVQGDTAPGPRRPIVSHDHETVEPA